MESVLAMRRAGRLMAGAWLPKAGAGSKGCPNGVIGTQLAVLFFLVLGLQLTQQGPREKDGQADTHENTKDDQNHSHEKLQSRKIVENASDTQQQDGAPDNRRHQSDVFLLKIM